MAFFEVGGNPEMILDVETGILVRDLSSKALSIVNLQILIDRELTKEMGSKARYHTLSKLSWDRTVNKLESINREVLQATRG